MMLVTRDRLWVVGGLALLASCASESPGMRARSLLPQAPTELGRCRVAASQSSPLVTEWPASEKANLEVLLRGGVVAVAYSGCSMRVLSQCHVKGGYVWQRTTPATDSLEINDADELYAKLPLGAASLEGELKRSGKLAVKTMIAGQLRADSTAMPDVPREGPCAQATHLVSALSLGAFALSAGGKKNVEAGAKVTGLIEAGGKRESSADLLRSAGDFESCGAGTDQGPHGNCASPIQAFLAPLPGRTEEEGPPGTIKVDFVSSNPASRWDVYADDKVICTTPCAQWVSAERPVMLRAREESFFAPPDKVQVANLLAAGGEGHVQLQAHPTARGKLATGITFSAFSGMAVLTGITLTAVGCGSDDRREFCTPGLITLGVGLPLLAGSVWLILDSMPKAELMPHQGNVLFARSRRPGLFDLTDVRVGPGVITGRF
jgi:hypothetical protein